MSDTLKEDKDGEYSNFVVAKDLSNAVDENGRITKNMMDDLREFKRDELMNLEENINNARLPTPDMFGIKRRFCKVCE